MQPFLVFLLAELGVFYLAVMGDVYLTNALVRWYGPAIEANPIVRQMYMQGNLKLSWLAVGLMLIPYAILAYVGLAVIEPYVPLGVTVAGAMLPILAMVNLLDGSRTFYRLKKRRTAS